MKKKFKRSLRGKVILSLVFMALILGAALMLVSYETYKNAMQDQYESMGNHIAKTTIAMLDDDVVKSITSQVRTRDPEAVMESEEYQTILSQMRRLKEANDVLYLYMIYPEKKGSFFIFDTDESEEQCPFGYFQEYYQGSFSKIVPDLLAGREVPAVISNEEYGWIISISYPYISNDELLGYICIDISMDEVVANRISFMRQLAFITVMILIILSVTDSIFYNHILIKPVLQMSDAAADYIKSKGESGNGPSPIALLNINTGDEFEEMCTSLKKMEGDLNDYMTELTTVTGEKERIGAELDVANRIQANMLPTIFPPFPERNEFDIFATMNPAKEVGGDFYDFFLLDDEHLAIVMADVSGKGVPAALFMVIAKILIKNRAHMGGTPAEILRDVNVQLCDGNDDGYFVTVWLSILEIATGKGIATNAGHENPLIKRADGQFELIRNRHSPALGVMDSLKFRTVEYQLYPGDRLFVYTDGVPEATDADNQMFGTERMLESLNRRKDMPLADILYGLKKDIDRFVGEAPQFDDVTMLCMDYFGSRSRTEGEDLSGKEEPAAVLEIPAKIGNLDMVNEFLETELDKLGCSMKEIMQIQLAAEEVFVNIASYAYAPGEGDAKITFRTLPDDPSVVEIGFADSGVPYDPLAREDPDITLSAEERGIGGLGVYMVKQNMDDVSYDYKDGQNHLTIRKKITVL